MGLQLLTGCVVLSRYLWRIAGKTPSDWEMKGVAIAAYTLAVICEYLDAPKTWVD